MLASEPQSHAVCTATQCPPPCMRLFVPKGTPTHGTSLWLPLGECVSGGVRMFSLCLGVSVFISRVYVALGWEGGLQIFLQAFLGSGFQGLLWALVTEAS